MSRVRILSQYKVLTNRFKKFSPLQIHFRSITSYILENKSWKSLENHDPRQEITRENSNIQNNQKRPTESFLDINTKIFKSPIADINGFSGIFLHDFVWKNVHKWWNKTALVCAETGRSYTYGNLRKLSGRLATSLRKNKIQPGEIVAVFLPNIPEYAILTMGASEAGIQLTLINPIYTTEEMRKQLQNSGAVAVVTIPEKYSVVIDSIKGNSTIRLPIIIIDDKSAPMPGGIINFNDFLSDNIEEFEKTGMKPEQNPDIDRVVLPYSSGTTGLPKGVELTHRNIVSNIMQDLKASSLKSDGSHQEILPLFLPLYHIYGLVVILFQNLSQGSKMICMPKFSSDALLKVLENNKSTKLYVAPPLVQLLANDTRFNKSHVENLKFMMSGAAPLGEEVIAKFFDRVGSHITFIQGYGLTEASPIISSSISCLDAPYESTGLLMPNTQVRIIGYTEDNLGKNLGLNEIGEIYVKGPQVMKGYFKNPQATESSMEGEWLKTGDLGSFDNEGYLWIRGRLKELIKVQGFQVAPAELEDVIQGHKKVADAAVIGVAHERYGEVPKAFVVPKPNMKIEKQEIMNHVAERVSKYKQLGEVIFVDKIPKSAAGKILRKELKKL